MLPNPPARRPENLGFVRLSLKTWFAFLMTEALRQATEKAKDQKVDYIMRCEELEWGKGRRCWMGRTRLQAVEKTISCLRLVCFR